MVNLFFNAELQDLVISIEKLTKQLPSLILPRHHYQLLLSLLERNSLELCYLLKNSDIFNSPSLQNRLCELILFIPFLCDYAFDSVQDELVDSHLTQIKFILEKISDFASVSSQSESIAVI
jgi:hypothetical protein